MTPAPLQVGQAPSELELNSAGFTPFAFANAFRIGSSTPVYVAGLLRRDPRIAAWSTTTTPSRPTTDALDQRALAGAGHAGEHAEHPEREVDVHVPQVVRGGAADLQRPGRRRTESLSLARSSRCRPVMVSLPRSPSKVPSKQTAPPAVPAPGTEIDDVVGDRDGLRLVLHDQHGVALVAQLQQQGVHPFDVVGVQPDRGLVEDVGDVGERRAQVADHLGALGLAAGQGAGRPVEGQVAQPDLGERVEEVLQPGEQRRHRRLVAGPGPSRPGR